jgi:tRNA1(Val) A37 N6-methylase TrmN6
MLVLTVPFQFLFVGYLMPESTLSLGDEKTLDHLLGGRISLEQPKTGLRASIDTVLLAAAVAAQAGEQVIELGTGTGAAALCLAARVETVRILGVEREAELVDLANRNAVRNGMAERFQALHADLAEPVSPEWFGRFDWVMMNPPYLDSQKACLPPEGQRARAVGEGAVPFERWVAYAAAVLRPRGHLALVHRADRLDDVILALRPRFGSLVLIPLWPRTGTAARRVILQARLGGRAPLRLTSGIILHQNGQGYTTEADACLRLGYPLETKKE